MKVAVVEDNEDSRILLSTALQGFGHEVEYYADGLEALAGLREATPDVIVSDILMPRMDGFDLCRVVKNDSLLHDIPFVFYTATYTNSRDEHLGRALGAIDFLIKPMEIDVLVKAIEAAASTRSPSITRAASLEQQAQVRDLQLNVVSKKLEDKIVELHNTNAALQLAEQRFRQLAENIRECFWITSISGDVLHYGSPAMAEIWGYTAQERITNPRIWREVIHPDDRERVEQKFSAIASDFCTDETFRIIKPEGNVRWLRDRAFPVYDANGKVYRVAGLTEDVTEAQRLSQELTYHATHDLLTGLMNRQAFEKRLEGALDTIQSGADEHALCYLDLDQFKVVNDSCGHAVGDKLLQEVSAVLSSGVRKSDSLARVGGDEFAVLMEQCTLVQAGRTAQSILDKLAAYRFEWEGATFQVGASMGLVALGGAIDTVGGLLAAADAACYVSKDLGGGRMHVYHAEDLALAARHGEMTWATRLNQAIDENRLELHYQGIHAMQAPHERADHVEVLVRLRDIDGRLVGPDEFIPAAHRYNLTRRLDQRVLELACEWLTNEGAWVRQCAINLCAPSLSDHTLIDRVAALLARHRLDGSRLCFEITETAAIGSLADASRLMQALGALGCRFAVDDFGSGFSSFAYLRALPVDYLKIDGQFVAGMHSDPIHLAMVKSINEIGHVMGKQTVAEWVENDAILEHLTTLGIDFAQGFGMSRPRSCKAT